MRKEYLVKETRIGYKTVIANSKKEAIQNANYSSEYFDDVGFVLDTSNKEHTAFLDINHKAYIVKSIK